MKIGSFSVDRCAVDAEPFGPLDAEAVQENEGAGDLA